MSSAALPSSSKGCLWEYAFRPQCPCLWEVCWLAGFFCLSLYMVLSLKRSTAMKCPVTPTRLGHTQNNLMNWVHYTFPSGEKAKMNIGPNSSFPLKQMHPIFNVHFWTHNQQLSQVLFTFQMSAYLWYQCFKWFFYQAEGVFLNQFVHL